MILGKGTQWGEPGALPVQGALARSDAEVRAIVEACRRRSEPTPPVGLLGGDLCRTLGGTGDEERLGSDAAMTFAVDVGAALLDGRLHWFVAHAVARRSWWRGRTVAAMNAQWLGPWDLGPRAHPGDGLLDVTDANLSLAVRLQARRRLPTGTHVPHPEITTRRVSSWQADFDPPLDVWLDGTKVGRVRHALLRVEARSLIVVV
jgi:hypothetical protein